MYAVQLCQGLCPKPSMTCWFERTTSDDLLMGSDNIAAIFPRGVKRWKEWRSGFSCVRFVPISAHFCTFRPTSVFTVFSLFLVILTCFELFLTLFLLTQANVHDAKNPAVTKDVLWRTRPMLDQIKKVNQKIWNLSHKVSIDEQTVGFQGRGYGAVRITYKNEGDGFQVLHVQSYNIHFQHSHKLNTRTSLITRTS